jgi:O-antigen/teichoic acid export membrane protein
MSLKKQTFYGVFWMFADTILLKGISFFAVLILARILGPKDFGLIGMISIFIAIGTSLIDSGLSSSIIRTENANESDYSTIFYLNIGVSCIIYLIIFFAAPVVAYFFDQEILTQILRLYCLSFFMAAMSSIHLAILEKEMQFKKIMFSNIPSSIVSFIIGIGLGYLGYGVWSIVWMYLTSQIIRSIFLWHFTKWRPKYIFSIERMKHHYKFGYKLLVSGLLDTGFKNIYFVLIGKYFSVQTLGYFERASTLNDYPVNSITGIINKVTFPLLSKIKSEKEKISSLYKQMLQLTFFVTTPAILGAAAISKPLFILILGKQWLDAVPLFNIICLASIFYPIHSFNISVFKVYGRSDLFLKLEIIKKIVTVICIICAFYFGIKGLVWSMVFSSFFSLLINTHYSGNMINYSTKSQFFDLLPTLMTSGFIYFVMLFFVKLLYMASLYIQIIIPVLAGLFLYIFINIISRSKNILLTKNLIDGFKL